MNDNTIFDEGMILAELEKENENYIDNVMRQVIASLQEKGYTPANQIVGYVMSGDPTYITSHNNARVLIQKIERDELLEVLVKRYLNNL